MPAGTSRAIKITRIKGKRVILKHCGRCKQMVRIEGFANKTIKWCKECVRVADRERKAQRRKDNAG